MRLRLTPQLHRLIETAVAARAEELTAFGQGRKPTLRDLTKVIVRVIHTAYETRMDILSRSNGELAGAVIYEQERMRKLRNVLEQLIDPATDHTCTYENGDGACQDCSTIAKARALLNERSL